jgi:hypothetical protein
MLGCGMNSPTNRKMKQQNNASQGPLYMAVRPSERSTHIEEKEHTTSKQTEKDKEYLRRERKKDRMNERKRESARGMEARAKKGGTTMMSNAFFILACSAVPHRGRPLLPPLRA